MLAGLSRTSTLFRFSSNNVEETKDLLSQLNILSRSPQLDINKTQTTCIKLLETDFHLLNDQGKTQLLELMINGDLWAGMLINESTFKNLTQVKEKLKNVITARVSLTNLDAGFQTLCPNSFLGKIMYSKRGSGQPIVSNGRCTVGQVALHLEQVLKTTSIRKLSDKTRHLLKNQAELFSILDQEKTQFPEIRNVLVQQHLLISRSKVGSIQDEDNDYTTNFRL